MRSYFPDFDKLTIQDESHSRYQDDLPTGKDKIGSDEKSQAEFYLVL